MDENRSDDGDAPGLPGREALLEFIRESERPPTVKEVARAFGVRGPARTELRRRLRELEAEGDVRRGRGRRMAAAEALPEVTVLEVTGKSEDGAFLAIPAAWSGDGPPPTVRLEEYRRRGERLGRGARVLARIARDGEAGYVATPIRILGGGARRALGIVERRGERGLAIRSIERGSRDIYEIAVPSPELRPGDAVLIEALPSRRRGHALAQVLERIGHREDPRIFSELAIHAHEIPHVFPPDALTEAEAAQPVELDGRTDLRELPLVTIDGEDARDFDDAVFAEPDPEVTGGWHLVVAIADVSWYVRPGGALDRVAYERGNSAYFPDRVVPMLPEALSNDLCSLRPNEDRACLAAHLWIDGNGELHRHRFVRGLMRSHARLTYEQVQGAKDGYPDATVAPLVEHVVRPLYEAFHALERARRRRGTLEIDLPERRVVVGDDGEPKAVLPRERLDSHRLIEEMMICANVAAAETLEKADALGMYRVHEQPDPAKAAALREYLADLGIKVSPGQLERPRHFNDLLARVSGGPLADLVNELVLRAQSQADYRPGNAGHFGLALERYAHFTSPIRRYADLVVHRALVAALKLGPGGSSHGLDDLIEAGTHISMTERRAAAAEREVVDRYTAAFLASRVGDDMTGRITGVARFGLFIRLDDVGADGFVPVATLPADWYDHDAARHALLGRQNGQRFGQGDHVRVRLVTADGITGSVLLEVLEVLESPTTDHMEQPSAKGRSRRKPSTASRPKRAPYRTRRR